MQLPRPSPIRPPSYPLLPNQAFSRVIQPFGLLFPTIPRTKNTICSCGLRRSLPPRLHRTVSGFSTALTLELYPRFHPFLILHLGAAGFFVVYVPRGDVNVCSISVQVQSVVHHRLFVCLSAFKINSQSFVESYLRMPFPNYFIELDRLLGYSEQATSTFPT